MDLGVQGDRRDRAAVPDVPKLAKMGTFDVPMKLDRGTVSIPFKPLSGAEPIGLEFHSNCPFDLDAKSGSVCLTLHGSKSLPFCQKLAELFGFTLTKDAFYRLEVVIRNHILDRYFAATWGPDTSKPTFATQLDVDGDYQNNLDSIAKLP